MGITFCWCFTGGIMTLIKIEPGFKRRMPWGTIALFLVFFSASFMNWGTIQTNLNSDDPDNMFPALLYTGSTPPNYITGSTELPRRGTLWQSGLLFAGIRIPHWLLFAAMAGTLCIEILVQVLNIRWLRKIAYVLDGYGLVISSTAVISFLYQGSPGPGVMSALCVFSSLAIFHGYAHNAVDMDGNYL